MLKIDTHLHSFFSSDSEASMEDMIRQGIRLGLKSLCFTEHFDLDYPENEENLDFLLNFDSYYTSSLRLREKYASQIEILHGIEVGVQPHLKTELLNFYVRYGGRFDYIINSCHIVRGEDPYEPSFFHKYSAEEGIRLYFETILKNLETFPYFQSAGHLDYICRYLPKPRPDFSYSLYGEVLDEILHFLIRHDKSLEVNTAGLKCGLPWPNPHMDILIRYRQMGGKLITIGSDAHRPEDIAFDFERLEKVLTQAGFSSYTMYRAQQPIQIPIL